MATLSNQSLMSSHESILTVVQRSAFSPGIFEEMERAAGLDPYNGNPGGRDKNVHLRWAEHPMAQAGGSAWPSGLGHRGCACMMVTR